jgi:hypothetical protein
MAAAVRQSVVPNFRKAAGVRNVYRSSAPDNLADYVGSSRRHLLESERFILYDATLLIDLRSLSEVDEVKRRALIQGAPGGQFEEIDGLESMMRSSHPRRQLLSLTNCALTRPDFEKYVSKHWVSPGELEKTREENRNVDLVYEAIDSHGLIGLVEVILESKLFISTVLKAITIHLEHNENGKVLIHCNLGKDRAGVVIMLCESMLGVKDDDIVDDFAQSICIQALAETRYAEIFKGRIDAVGFSHALPQTMMRTLEYLRHKYGSITKYLDSISFDESWRRRFVLVAS